MATSVLGGQSEATIDQANIAMRGSPWYQTQMRAWGQDPGHPTLTAWQSDQIRRLAQANGYQVDEGNIEVDDHGNFNPKGHKLRNTLIVVGLAAATIATMGAAGAFAGAAGAGGAGASAGAGAGAAGAGAGLGAVEGGAYGLSSTALAGLGTGAMGTVPVATTLGGAAAAGAGALPAGVTLEGTAAGGGGASTTVAAGTPASLVGKTLSAEGIEAAKDAGYTVNADGVVMDAANVAPDYIQSASGSSGLVSNLLKYALPIGGQVASSLIAANASSNASAAQTKYLEDALAYEKENDLYKRGVDAAAVAKEAARYGDYQGRIAPFIDNGTASNDRMSSLLGLPARSGAITGGASSYSSRGFGGSAGGAQGVPITPQITQKILDNYASLGLTPTGAGSGPTDTAYFAQRYAETGGSTPDNDSYWFGPNGRIAKEARQAGVTFGTPGATSPTSQTPPAPAPASAPPVTGAPVARALVKMRAPDGSVQDVPADQVEHYTQRGATVF